jgi:hypothetical protein
MSQAGRFVWDAEAAPMFDDFVVVSADLPRPQPGDWCRVVAKANVRKGSATDSAKVGELEKNERFELLKQKVVDGQPRLRFDKKNCNGWASLRSKKGRWLIMKDHTDLERRVVYHISYPRAGGAAPPMIEHFCMPTAAEVCSDVVHGTEKAVYTFVRTLDAGERQYGFCIRVVRRAANSGGPPGPLALAIPSDSHPLLIELHAI